MAAGEALAATGYRLSRVAAVAATAFSASIAVAVLVLRAGNAGAEAEGRNWWTAAGIIVGVVDVAVGALVIANARRRAVGIALVLVGASLLVSSLSTGYGAFASSRSGSLAGAGFLAGLQAPAGVLAVGVLGAVIPLYLPGGRLRRPLGPAALAVATAALAAAVVAAATRAPPWTPLAPASPLLIEGDGRAVLDALERGGRWALALLTLAAVAAAAAEWWRSRPAADPLPGWLTAGAIAAGLVALPVLSPGFEARVAGASVALPLLVVATVPLVSVAILIGATREKAGEAGRVSHRLLEWLLLASGIAATYTLAVGGLGSLVGGSGPTWLLVAATGAVALGIEPVRGRIRHLVDDVLYGERGDPLALVRGVMQQVTTVADVDQLLPTLAGTLATALRLQYVRIDAAGAAGWARTGEYGIPTDATEALALRHHSQTVGRLVVGWIPGSSLRRRDRAVLDELLSHLAQVVSWIRLTLDLRRSGLAVISAAEDERRRLRRDLHDGLGPALTGISLGLRTGLNKFQRSEPAPDSGALALLASLADEVDRTVGDVKKIVRDLRPTALDERDLSSAIADLVRRLEPAVHVHLDLPAGTITLPAAVEVATYRLASEAITNVVRHAAATECWVRLAVDGAVALDIFDDGVGLPAEHMPGVGVAAMGERVAELGGTFSLSPNSPRGTRLCVTLPATLP
jgi:two-component system, NarL family, sensor kinase